MNIKILSKILTTFALLAALSVAKASPIEFDFTGKILVDVAGVLTNDFSLQGKYTVDNATDNLSSDPTSGVYVNIGSDFIFQAIIGGTSYELDGATFINVEHDLIDQYVPTASDGALTLQLFLQTEGGKVFNDVSQPTSTFDLTKFDLAQFRLITADGLQFLGSLDSLTCTGAGCGSATTAVPEPSSLAFTAFGLLGLGVWMRSRKSQSDSI